MDEPVTLTRLLERQRRESRQARLRGYGLVTIYLKSAALDEVLADAPALLGRLVFRQSRRLGPGMMELELGYRYYL